MSREEIYKTIVIAVIILSFWFSATSIAIYRELHFKYDSRRFNLKILFDFLSYPAVPLTLVFAKYMNISIKNPGASKIIVSICIINSILSLCTFTVEFVFWERTIFASKLSNRFFPIVLADFICGLILTLSAINYTIYYIWPDFYVIPAGLSLEEIAFEFIYYTFTLAVTYSSSSISAAHIVTKIVQIFEICYCYIIAGHVVIDIINKQRSK